MRQKLTACTVLCLLECILQASAKDRLDFSGSCHFLCTLFSLTFPSDLPATPLVVLEKALHHVHYYATPHPPQSWFLFFILTLTLFPPLVPLTSEIVISETLLSLPSHPLLFSPPFHLVSSLVSPSCLSFEACKNTCASLLFVHVHKCTNAWMSGNCQSGEVEGNCDGKNGDEGAENTWTAANIQTAKFRIAIPSRMWFFVL